MEPAPTSQPPHSRLRISLRTMLALVFFVGSLQLLFTNKREPWEMIFGGHVSRISSDGERLLVQPNASSVEWIELRNGFQRKKLSLELPARPGRASLPGLIASSDCRRFLISDRPSHCIFYDAERDRVMSTFDEPILTFEGITFYPDLRTAPKSVNIRSPFKGEFSPDGSRFLSLFPMVLRDTATGKTIENTDIGEDPLFAASGEIYSSGKIPWTTDKYGLYICDANGKFKKSCDVGFRNWRFLRDTDREIVIAGDVNRSPGLVINTRNGLMLETGKPDTSNPPRVTVNPNHIMAKHGSRLFVFYDETEALDIVDTATMRVIKSISAIKRAKAPTWYGDLYKQVDAKTLAEFHDLAIESDAIDHTPYENGKQFIVDSQAKVIVVSATTPEVLWAFHLPKTFPGAKSVHWIPSSRLLVVEGQNAACIFHNRHPEEWWGITYLWEFWLSAALLLLLNASLRQDRKIL